MTCSITGSHKDHAERHADQAGSHAVHVDRRLRRATGGPTLQAASSHHDLGLTPGFQLRTRRGRSSAPSRADDRSSALADREKRSLPETYTESKPPPLSQMGYHLGYDLYPELSNKHPELLLSSVVWTRCYAPTNPTLYSKVDSIYAGLSSFDL